MKRLKIAVALLMLIPFIFSSCKKVAIPVVPPGMPATQTSNKLPVSKAGIDQILTLPVNTTTLNGDSSFDPDGTIIYYSWSQVSGPGCGIIATPGKVATTISSLCAGTYQFCLQVTDNLNANSYDTVLIRVNPSSQLTNIGSLSIQRDGMAVGTANNKIVIAGGYNYDPWYGDIRQVYSRVDVYDCLTNSWTVAELSQARMEMAVSSVGNKIFFAGGITGDWKPTSRVDIYDAVTNLWSTAELSEARACIAISAGNKILFAGGTTDWSGTVLSNRVDIYDASMNSWSTTVLPNAAAGIVPGSVGNKILLPRKSNSVDIYDVASNTWSVSNLNETIWASASITVNNKAMFVSSIGGSNPVYSSSSKHVNIYNAANSTWSLDSLNQFNVLDPIPRSFFGAATAGNFSVFITTLQRYLVYDGSNNTWAMTPDTHYEFKGLPSIISANNKIYITDAGGLWKVQL